MATVLIETTGTLSGYPTKRGVLHPSVWERYVDLADATTVKGSDLTSGDVIQVFTIPVGSVVHGALFEVMNVSTSTGATASLSITGGTVFTTAQALTTTGIKTTVVPFETGGSVLTATSDTLDLTLVAPGSVAPTVGLIRVVAFVTDVSASRGRATIASRDVL